jgi:hypothetical protein
MWVPTMAMAPRYSDSGSDGSAWYFPATVAAGFLLGAVFARRWKPIGFGLVAPQLLLAGWTTPRGDNDGLWTLIFPALMCLGVVAFGSAWVGSKIGGRIRVRTLLQR